MTDGNSDKEKEIRSKIDALTKEFFKLKEDEKKFIPGKTKIQYSGPIFDENEVNNVMSSLFDGWLASGKLTREFESLFAKFIGAKYCDTVDSGSSALTISLLATKNKGLKNPMKDGDEVIASAMNHPATINSILHNNLKPVLVDIDMKNYNFDINLVEKAITDKTRGILPMHFLGNPCEMDQIMELAKKHDLFVVEDCCDAYGSKYKNKNVGTFGDFAGHSFYCAHMITTGNGGAITYDRPEYSAIIKSLRAWGRACVCPVCDVSLDPSYDCPTRFDSESKGFEGYDKRYMFTNIGYNSQIVEMQGAFAVAQMKRLPKFIEIRRKNFNMIVEGLKDYGDSLILPEPTPESDPAWFALPLTVNPKAGFKRKEIVDFIEKHNIETRPFFAGNLRNQPAYKGVDIKLAGVDTNTEMVKDNSFFIGCYPGITEEMIAYIVEVFGKFFKKYS
jgi:CDP-6-deoxy-D-xylo-4-hexulose-3-dehydrase